MSWEGFKKAINRAGHSVIIKNVDKTIDKEYDMEERRYKVLQRAGEALQKEAKGFKEIEEAIKKRDHKKQDFDAAKAKVRRLVDKPAKDASKLPRAEKELSLAKDIFENLNNQLKTELPQLVSLRVPYFDPSFEALIKIQLRFCTDGYTRLAQIQQYLDQQSRDDYANGLLDTKIEELLGQMTSLDICALGIK